MVLASAMRAVDENGTEEAMGGKTSPCLKGIVLTKRHSKCGMCAWFVLEMSRIDLLSLTTSITFFSSSLFFFLTIKCIVSLQSVPA